MQHSIQSSVQRKLHAQIIVQAVNCTAKALAEHQRHTNFLATTLQKDETQKDYKNTGRTNFSCFVSCLRTLSVSRHTASDGRLEKICGGGSGHDLIEALSRHVPRRNEEHHEKTSSQDTRCPGRDVNAGTSEAVVLPTTQ
jgi:hypothetical protein